MCVTYLYNIHPPRIYNQTHWNAKQNTVCYTCIYIFIHMHAYMLWGRGGLEDRRFVVNHMFFKSVLEVCACMNVVRHTWILGVRFINTHTHIHTHEHTHAHPSTNTLTHSISLALSLTHAYTYTHNHTPLTHTYKHKYTHIHTLAHPHSSGHLPLTRSPRIDFFDNSYFCH